MKLKWLVGITLFLFFVLSTGIVVAGLLSYQNGKSVKMITPAANNKGDSAGTTPTASGMGGGGVLLTPSEIAKHSSVGDCWLVIGGKVYDVTTALNSHPGGVGTIAKYCGKDGSGGWNTKDSFPGRVHSQAAQFLLRNFLLGDVNATVTTTDIQKTQSAGSAASVNLRGRENGEGDD